MASESVTTLTRSFARYERPQPTLDGPSSFWIACDESGQDGESLTSVQTVMAHAAVRIDDNDADAVVSELRNQLRSMQGAELKFARFNSSKTVSVLTRALADPALLGGRCSVQVVDKRYVAAGKIIDLIVEEHAYEHGEDMYVTGEAKAMAQDLLVRGPGALGQPLFDRLLDHFVSLFRMGEPGGRPRATVDKLFECLREAVAAATNRRVRAILERILLGRDQVDYFIAHLRGSDGLGHLQPVIPALVENIRYWDRQRPRHGTLMVLHDRQNLLSDETIAELRRGMRYPSPLISVAPPPVIVGAFLRGDSKTHPSIQLADLVAGAGRVAGEYAMGRRTDNVAEQLSTAIRPIVAAGSLWGDQRTWKLLTDMPF